MTRLAMDRKGEAGSYSGPAKLFHWATLLLVGWLVWLAWGMVELPIGVEKFERYNLHKSLGVTLLTLTFLRLLWRRISPPPPLPDNMKDWERRAAQASHGLLYAMMIAQPVVGILHSWLAGYPIVVFGLFALPNPLGPDKGLQDILSIIHAWLGWSFVGLILLHMAAAVKHHLIDRDDVLLRMLPGWPRKDD